ncbi:MAG: DUF2341 domain-containing protein [Candidatus Daviesbacteria bacterium]|nr:DUF2341 domain-containing protein [Candidatus Daviesbacteria bacterium]
MKIKRKKLWIKIIGAFGLGVIIIGLAFFFWPKGASASWMDENWLYRVAIPISDHTAAETNVYTTVTIDTATPITAGKMQSDCGDLRFTKENGELLSYFINASPGCNNAATTIQVNFDSFPAGAQTIYYYYGNPSAENGFNYAAFSTAATGATIGSVGSETQGPGPVAYWKFDDGQGTTTQDSASSNNDGTLSGTTIPTWQTEDLCVSGKCLFFDGSTSYVDGGNNASLRPTKVTASAWIRGIYTASAHHRIIAEYDGTNNNFILGIYDKKLYGFVWVGNTQYNFNGNTTLSDNTWYHASMTYDGETVTLYLNGKVDGTLTSPSGNMDSDTVNLRIGNDSSGAAYFKGFIDEPKVYPYARTAAQIKTDYNSHGAGTAKGAGTTLGATTQDYLSNGLVGYWKMDESSGNAADSSGNSNTGTWNGTGASHYSAGKFGNGGGFNGTDDYATGTLSSSLQPTRITISLWWQAQSTGSNQYIIDTNGDNSNYGYTIQTNANITGYYVTLGGVASDQLTNYTFTAGNWYHFIATYDGSSIITYINGARQSSFSISSSPNITYSGGAFNIGRNNNNSYFIKGILDEIRVYNRALSPKEVSDLYNWAPGPVGYWRMDDKVAGASKTITDVSGNGNNGTTYSANGTGMDCVKSPGKYGGGCEFDGVDDYVDTGSGASLTLGVSDFTLEAWVKTSKTTGNQVVFKKRNGGNWYTLYIVPSGRAKLELTADDRNTAATGNIADGTWHHIAITRNYSGNSSTIYIDGASVASTKVGTMQIDVTNAATLIMGRYGASSEAFLGLIDDVRIYNYARTQKQIVSDMLGSPKLVSSGGGNAGQGAVAHWKLDEGYSTTANDSTSNNNDLTLSSASWTDSGKFGKAFNGTGALWLSRADDSDFDVTDTDDYAVSLWFKSDSAANPSAVEYLFNKAAAATAGYAVYANTSGNICFGIDDDTTWGPDVSSCSPTDIYDNTWHHIMAVRDHNNTDKTLIYVDGVLKDSDTDSTTATLANSLSLYIGDRDGTDNGDEFNGDLDEIKVYRYTLTSDEVKTEYNRGSSLVLGAAGNNSTYAQGAANQEYCVPGDSTSCAAPVGRWDFEEGTGTAVNDTSGNGNTGTFGAGAAAPIWTKGKIGKAISTNIGSQYVSVANESNFDFTSDFTIETWLNIDPTNNSAFRGVLGKYQQDSSGWDFGVQSNQIRMTTRGTSSIDTGAVGNNLGSNAWHHITIVNTPTSIKIYEDGVLTNTTSGTWTSATNNVAVTIGNRDADTFTSGFIGKLDGVKIFNYARSAAQVAYDYNRGKPVGWWKMDECQGTVANDSSGNNNSGTITIGGTGTQTGVGTCIDGLSTSTWANGATGKRNASLNFDGTDDYITMGDPASGILDPGTGNFTLSAWVKTTMTTQGGIISKEQAAGNSRYYMSVNNSPGTNPGKLGFYLKDTSGNSLESAIGTKTFNDGSWHHVAIAFDRTANLAYGYIDGAQIGSVSISTVTGTITNTFNFAVGARNEGSTLFFNGQIDDVQIFNYALTSTQVKDVYNNGAVNFAPSTGSP